MGGNRVQTAVHAVNVKDLVSNLEKGTHVVNRNSINNVHILKAKDLIWNGRRQMIQESLDDIPYRKRMTSRPKLGHTTTPLGDKIGNTRPALKSTKIGKESRAGSMPMHTIGLPKDRVDNA
jgi:hypothetical protein